MKLVSRAGQLAATLRTAGTIIQGPAAKRFPGANAARLSAADGGIMVHACSLDASLSLTIPADVTEAGETAVVAEKLKVLAAGMPKTAALTISTEADIVVVESGSARFEFPAVPISELAALPVLAEATSRATLSREQAFEAFDRIAFAMSTENTRYYLNGAYVHSLGTDLAVAATDGHRLARSVVPGAGSAWPEGCIIPAAAVKVLVKLLGAHRQLPEVIVRRAGGLVEIAGGGFLLTSKLIDETSPRLSARRRSTFRRERDHSPPRGTDRRVASDSGVRRQANSHRPRLAPAGGRLLRVFDRRQHGGLPHTDRNEGGARAGRVRRAARPRRAEGFRRQHDDRGRCRRPAGRHAGMDSRRPDDRFHGRPDADAVARRGRSMSGRAPRAKGNRIERELVDFHKALGVHAERYPLSGASRFRGSGHDVDVYLFGRDAAPLTAEVKARAGGGGFVQLERWLGEFDLLFLRRDRADPLVAMPWRTWAALLAKVPR